MCFVRFAVVRTAVFAMRSLIHLPLISALLFLVRIFISPFALLLQSVYPLINTSAVVRSAVFRCAIFRTAVVRIAVFRIAVVRSAVVRISLRFAALPFYFIIYHSHSHIFNSHLQIINLTYYLPISLT